MLVLYFVLLHSHYNDESMNNKKHEWTIFLLEMVEFLWN